ncbi:MAG: hypothetical protein ACUVUF_07300, partial [Candidatus Bathycorpusculaceae bacterium]
EEHLKALLNDSGFEVTKSFLTEKKPKMKGMLVIVAQKREFPMQLVVPKEEEHFIIGHHIKGKL